MQYNLQEELLAKAADGRTGFVFVADFIRALHRIGCNPNVEFIRLISYGLGRMSSGNVRLIGETELDLAGRAVLLVDDIVDSGRTLLYARDVLHERGVSSILTCALVDKPSRREVAIDPDFGRFHGARRFYRRLWNRLRTSVAPTTLYWDDRLARGAAVLWP